MKELIKTFPGERKTYLWRQTPGERNAIYPWVIRQGNNGAVVKLSDEQMLGIVDTVLEVLGYSPLSDTWKIESKRKERIEPC